MSAHDIVHSVADHQALLRLRAGVLQDVLYHRQLAGAGTVEASRPDKVEILVYPEFLEYPHAEFLRLGCRKAYPLPTALQLRQELHRARYQLVFK